MSCETDSLFPLLPQVREIWLSSEDTGAYGRDIGTDIAELLRRMADALPRDGSVMLRLGMTNPPYMLQHLEAVAEVCEDRGGEGINSHPRCITCWSLVVDNTVWTRLHTLCLREWLYISEYETSPCSAIPLRRSCATRVCLSTSTSPSRVAPMPCSPQ